MNTKLKDTKQKRNRLHFTTPSPTTAPKTCYDFPQVYG